MMISSLRTLLTQPVEAQAPTQLAVREPPVGRAAQVNLGQPPQGVQGVSGDNEMAFRYAKTLLQIAGDPEKDNAIMVEAMPMHSTFGQWWKQLGSAMQSPEVLDWIRRVGADPDSIRIKPDTGQVFYNPKNRGSNPPRLVVGPENKDWATVSGPLMMAGRAISNFYVFKPPLTERSDSAPWKLVRAFYFQPPANDPTQAQEQAVRLERDLTFVSVDGDRDPAFYAARSDEALNEQKRVRGDNSNLYFLLGELRHLGRGLDSGSVLSDEIVDYLQRTRLDIHPDSSWAQAFATQAGAKVSLNDYILQNGWDLPTNAEQVQNLLDALPKTLEKGPALGDYSGALSWPMPLDEQSQLTLRSMLRHATVGDLDVSPYKNVLEYLLHGASLEPSQTANPRRVLDRLIQSPKGQALGLAIQARFEANSIKGSVNDWLLAALSQDTDAPAPNAPSTRTRVAGFNLAGDQHWGRPASQVVTRLAEHLETTGRSSSPEKARLQAHLLLSSRAPEFLVKGLPEQLLYGSHGWVSFATAVARIESATPGATADMSHSQVMTWASTAPVTQTQRKVEWEAQNTALKDWGVANGVIESNPHDVYNDGQMQRVRSAFNEQIRALKQASEARSSDVPDLHKRTDDYLRATLGPDVDLEAKVIQLSPAHVDFPGPYSIKDLYLKERLFSLPGKSSGLDNFKAGRFYPLISAQQTITQTSGSDYRWVSLSDKLDIADVASKLKEGPDLIGAFRQDISTYAKAMEKSVEVGINFNLSQLPLEEQKDLQYGALSVFREVGVRRDNFGGTTRRVGNGASNEPEPTELIFRTTRNAHTRHYQINVDGTIKQRPDLGLFEPGRQPPVHTHFHYDMVPVKLSADGLDSAPGLTEETPPDERTPQSFNSNRTKAIARTVTQELGLVNKIQQQGQVLTTFDQEVPTYKQIQEVVLNLIPFYSAIVSFSKGDIGGGITDLAFDALGFLTAGAGVVGKGAKVLRSAASGLSKASRLTGIIGRAAIGAINPLDGVADLARGAVKSVRRGYDATRAGFKQVRGALTKVDALALAKTPGIAQGGIKSSNAIDELALFARLDEKTGNWHAINPATRQPFGPALKGFEPKVLSSAELSDNLVALFKKLDKEPQLDICYATALRAAQADKKITDTAFKKIIPEVLNGGSERYNQVMKIGPGTRKSSFNAADITESGVMTFVSRGGYNKDKIVHAVYLQKAPDGQLHLYQSNSHALDHALGGTKQVPNTAGKANVYPLGAEQQAGIQEFMDTGAGFDIVFTPSSTLESSIRGVLA